MTVSRFTIYCVALQTNTLGRYWLQGDFDTGTTGWNWLKYCWVILTQVLLGDFDTGTAGWFYTGTAGRYWHRDYWGYCRLTHWVLEVYWTQGLLSFLLVFLLSPSEKNYIITWIHNFFVNLVKLKWLDSYLCLPCKTRLTRFLRLFTL